jgi:hypothetical protein
MGRIPVQLSMSTLSWKRAREQLTLCAWPGPRGNTASQFHLGFCLDIENAMPQASSICFRYFGDVMKFVDASIPAFGEDSASRTEHR